MKFVTKNTKHGQHRTHLVMDGKVICGGGNGARAAQWQETFTKPDCLACLTILKRWRKET